MEARRAVTAAFNALLDSVDAVVCPSGGFTLPVPQKLLYGGTTELQPVFEGVQMQFTIPANFAGTPTLTVPCGFSESTLPYTLQFMGPRLSEARLCKIGHAYEQATEWHERHPSI